MCSSKSGFAHYDLRTGLVATVKRAHDPLLKDELWRAVLTSNETRRPMPIAGGRFQLTADLTTVRLEASACFYVSAGPSLGNEAVQVGTVLYETIAVHWLATAPNVFRFHFARYLSSVSSAAPLTRWNAPASMPRGALIYADSPPRKLSPLFIVRRTCFGGSPDSLVWEFSRPAGDVRRKRKLWARRPRPTPHRFPELRGYDNEL